MGVFVRVVGVGVGGGGVQGGRGVDVPEPDGGVEGAGEHVAGWGGTVVIGRPEGDFGCRCWDGGVASKGLGGGGHAAGVVVLVVAFGYAGSDLLV